MHRLYILLLLVACASTPDGPSEGASEPNGHQEEADPPGSEPQPSAPASHQSTPAQERNVKEGRTQAQADLARGEVQILDFGEMPPSDHLDPKTGLPLGSMGCEWDEEMEIWRDAYNDTVLEYVKATPPFPEPMEILYTVFNWPDEVQHLRLRITSDQIERTVMGKDAPVSLSYAERLKLGVLAQNSMISVPGSLRNSGMQYAFSVKNGARDWQISGGHPPRSIGRSSELAELLTEIGAR